MLTAKQLHGIITALPTPVRADVVDAGAVSALFAWLLRQGVDGVLPLGGTGEYGSLARAGHLPLVELSPKAMARKGPVIPRPLAPRHHRALPAARAIAAGGADPGFGLPPYYNHPP